MDHLDYYISKTCELLWSWPLILFFVIVGFLTTVMLNFVQFKYFFYSWKLILSPPRETKEVNIKESNKQDTVKSEDKQMTSVQAFLNALSSSVGNGSLAGVATAVYDGGPGAVFWIFLTGFFSMSISFSEVYLSNAYKKESDSDDFSVGPMAYLKHVPGKLFLPSLYAVFALLLSFTGGNASQTNSIRVSLQTISNIPSIYIALAVLIFLLYIFTGGSSRVLKISEKIIPFKVGLFFTTAIILLAYNYSSFFDAINIIISHAFTIQAFKGAIVGKTIQEAMRYGIARSINASQAGLGVAGIFFGSTASKNPVKDGIMSIPLIFISNFLVSTVVGLIIVMSGVWNSGLTSTDLTIAAYNTAFGALGSWLVAALAVVFGVGVLIAFGFVGRECWAYLTKGRYIKLYYALYILLAIWGTMADVEIVWKAVDLANAGLLFINLYAILILLPHIRKAVKSYRH